MLLWELTSLLSHPLKAQRIARASLLPRVLCRASHLCQGEEVVSGSPLSGAGFHTPLCSQNHRIIGKDSSDAACRDTWSRWYWQSFSWVVSELQKPKPRGHGLHPCSSMMCKKGTSNGTGVVCTTGRSSEEGQLQDEEGTFPDKTSLCTGNLFKREMRMCGSHCKQLPQAVRDVALPLLYPRSISAQLGAVAGLCMTMRLPTHGTCGFFSFSFL